MILDSSSLWLRGAFCAAFLGVGGSARSEALNVTESPWGIASGAERSGDYPKFNPMLRDAGVTWLRYFPEWRDIQPKQGVWNWDGADRMIANARENHLRMAGIFLYFAPWAASGKGSRAFPVKDIKYWEEYVSAVVARYAKDIQYWEVWNEGNSIAFNSNGTPKHYAEMVRVAYDAAKKASPAAKIGITCAAFDLHYFDQVIKAGAADHFDYVCVHPYNNIGLVFGSEQSFLGLAGNIRRMLESNGQRKDIELWMSEIGLTTTTDPAQLKRQAEALVKTYVLGLAQGFRRICWFEAVGPKYGDGVHSILADDLSPFPAYDSLKVMTQAMGPFPKYLGWLNLSGNSYGFVFENSVPVLAIWAVKDNSQVTFDGPVEVTKIDGSKSSLKAGSILQLDTVPVFVSGISGDLAAQAKANKTDPFPWVADYSKTDTVKVILGPENKESGLRQGNNDPREDGRTVSGTFRGEGYRSTDLAQRRPFIYFEADSSFAGWGDQELEITVVARRSVPNEPAVMTLVYESETGYHEYGKRAPFRGMNAELIFESESFRAPELWYLAAGEEWQEHTWKISDACFIGKWGWHFQINVEPSSSDVWVKEVRVKKLDRKKP